MKKSIVLIALACGTSQLLAQDLTSKKGEPILPEAGDWSIGIDAVSLINTVGNAFGKTGSTAPAFSWITNNNTIVGKYFIAPQTALRGGIRLGFGGETRRFSTTDRASLTTPPVYPGAYATKENSWKTSTTAIGLSFGIEKRRGKTRLQGFYGAEAGIYYSGSKDKFSYGNGLVAPGNGGTVITVDAVGDSIPGANNIVSNPLFMPPGNTDGKGLRITERKYGSQFTFGLRAFIGVEYFILPKMSLGGEFGWGLGITSVGKSSTTYESTGNTSSTAASSVGTTTITDPKSGSFRLDTDNKNSVWGASGALRLNFYF